MIYICARARSRVCVNERDMAIPLAWPGMTRISHCTWLIAHNVYAFFSQMPLHGKPAGGCSVPNQRHEGQGKRGRRGCCGANGRGQEEQDCHKGDICIQGKAELLAYGLMINLYVCIRYLCRYSCLSSYILYVCTCPHTQVTPSRARSPSSRLARDGAGARAGDSKLRYYDGFEWRVGH